ncbi:hypothetical protein [Rheinheimera baltica]|uniref:hypothetical protein n=1 Tax=Rheinheimera baltica TaxID=67576 RepID=UPI00040046C5|nr:hypothetical protein [Rheinheimera baltica]MDP5192021.1 hypothetical protein [Rheinheimera baltica]
MLNKILGVIGVVWGSAIIINWILTPAAGNEAYNMGQLLSVVFGVVLAIAGGYTILNAKQSKPD